MCEGGAACVPISALMVMTVIAAIQIVVVWCRGGDSNKQRDGCWPITAKPKPDR